MADASNSSSDDSSLEECRAETEFLRRKAISQVLSVMNVIKKSEAVLRESQIILGDLRNGIPLNDVKK